METDNSITDKDDGRGSNVDTHEQTGKSALEGIMTVLHAGGKFGGGGDNVSGGLHGVGAAVVNALSSTLEVYVQRDGKVHYVGLEQGIAQEAIEVIGETDMIETKTQFKPEH